MNILIIDSSKPKECSVCHKVEELRPYGKDGAFVCFDCAMNYEAEAERQFAKLLKGKDVVIIK